MLAVENSRVVLRNEGVIGVFQSRSRHGDSAGAKVFSICFYFERIPTACTYLQILRVGMTMTRNCGVVCTEDWSATFFFFLDNDCNLSHFTSNRTLFG
jgi:hypothetical protein